MLPVIYDAGVPRELVRVAMLEGMDFQEQALLFANASVVVSVHGAALGNMIMMNEGSAAETKLKLLV